MNYPLAAILSHFAYTGSVEAISPFGSGHIHDTYRVRVTGTTAPGYIMQRINHQIFKQIPELMENVGRITEYLREKLQRIPGADPQRETLTVIPALTGKLFYQDESGNYWRLYQLITGARSYDVVTTPAQAYQGGKAFGRFGARLIDFPISTLHETLPDFHHINKRLQTLWRTLEKDPVGRAAAITPEVQFIKARAEPMGTLLAWGNQELIPQRVTHNDTKFNNVLLSEQDRALCVVDLDTVMPGYVAYDFGDSIRTTASTAAEDEKDLHKVGFDIDLFKAYAEGYLEEMGKFLTSHEWDSLVLGCQLMPYMMGVRFLTDYVDGDHYYKVHHPEHNLQRARNQFRLLSVMEAQTSSMQSIITALRP